MDRKIVLSLLAAVALGFVGIMMMLPGERPDGVARLPWRVAIDDEGRARVFGFTIGETTLAEVRDVFGEEGKVNLFVHRDREPEYSAEAYFDQIYLNGLRADFVISLAVGQTELEAMYGRGLRISQIGSGAKKVKLTPRDIDTLARRPVRAITYLPWKSLDAEILQNRFGAPEQTIAEESGITHWLYPARGMDIGLDADGGVVIQYLDPAAFEEVLLPLMQRRSPVGPRATDTEPPPAGHPRAR